MTAITLYLSWAPVWGKDDPRVAALKDDVEGLRRRAQGVDAAQRVWESWFLRSQGASINFDGAAGHASVPAGEIGDLDAVRRQVKQCLGDAEIAVGVALKVSEADLALKLALRRNGTVVFYTDEVPKALEEKKEDPLLQKADGPAPQKVAENSPAGGGGFSGASQPGAPSVEAPAGEASEHSQGEAMASLADDGPSAPESTHAGADFENQFKSAADQGQQEDDARQAQTADGVRAADLKNAVVAILKNFRAQGQTLEQMKALEPNLYAAVQGCIKAMLMMAKELVGTAPVQKSEPEMVEALEKKGDAIEAGIPVEHYSSQPNLQAVHPRFQGTGSAGPEKQRPNRVPRSYFYVAGTKPEAHVAANAHKYQGRLHPATRLYDFGEDPAGHLNARWEQTPQGQIYKTPDLDEVEAKLKSGGYHGYQNYGVPGALALFHPLPVRPAAVQKSETGEKVEFAEKKDCHHFYGRGNKCLRCRAEKVEKGKLPLPENTPTHTQHHYAVGATKDSGPGGTRDVGKVKVQHADDGKTSWVSVRAGQVLSQDGHAISSRNPGGK